MDKKEIYEGYTIYEDGTLIGKRGQKMSFSDNGKGYLIIGLMLNGKRVTKAQHRLLAEAFIPNPDNLPEVDHKDADRSNNSLDNLRWITHGGNIEHSFNMENRNATGENNANCCTEETIVKQICELLSKGLSSAGVRNMGFDYSLVRTIKARKNWKHISRNYVW